tara:strand:- start:349 stop:519 length:171 start_codon:yes stop_codon:yes gene_type:complete
MKVKNLINYLESVDKNATVCIQTKEGIFKIRVIEESVDADYNEIYLKNHEVGGEIK